jgi:formylglycine-generating enzyme required for sulfatase activity
MGRVQRWALAMFGAAALAAGACDTFSTPATTADAGADGRVPGGDADVDAAIDPCGGFDAGPKMARVTKGAGSFCVDTLEVSFDQYQAFRLAPDSGGPPPRPLDAGGVDPCVRFTLDSTEKRAAYPARVEFCAARAYCAWAGKRLCSAEFHPPDELDTTGEWYVACSPHNTDYPWGEGDDGGARRRCPGAGEADAALPVGTSPDCRADDAGIYDMIGNAAEWVEGAGDLTNVPGGTFAAAIRGLSADAGRSNCKKVDRRGQVQGGRDVDGDRAGVRCCADAKK